MLFRLPPESVSSELQECPVAAISIRFDQQADALREARRLAAETAASVYVVQILEADGRPWEVRDTLPKNRPWLEVAPDEEC